MSEFKNKAKAVIIGAGIVGNSVACHLARLGWKDMVMVDKGPLPSPGGSTGHASNFTFIVEHSKVMTQLTQDSIKQYEEMGVFRKCGGMELARTKDRAEEFKRKLGLAKSWGSEAEIIEPVEAKKLFPWINEKIIKSALWMPGVGVVDSLRAGTIMREEAQGKGALEVYANTEVLGIDVENNRVKAIRTTRGEIQTECIVIACGVWSPRIAEMAGATIPLAPMVHQMIDAGPIVVFEKTEGEIEYPVVRDMSVLMYERQAGRNMEVGSYAHKPIIHHPNDIPSIEASKLSPTELPFTMEDFEPQMEDALALMPEILDRDDVEIQYAINGLISLTADGEPVLGETVEVKNLWSAAAVWIKEGPGVGKMIAEWMTHGVSEIDSHELDISRFYDYARTEKYVYARCNEGFNRIYGIVHPAEQWKSSRATRVSPFYSLEKELGAFFFEAGGWERPFWYESNKKLLDEFGDRVMDRRNEWDSRWWSPIINAEHLAMRERVAMIDLSAFAVFDLGGPSVVDYIQKMAVNQMNVPIGKAVYTPLLNLHGGIKADLTIIRTAENIYRIITGVADGNRDKKWLMDNLPDDGSVYLDDRTSALCTIGVWGPKAINLLKSVCKDDLSDKGLAYGYAKNITIDKAKVWALRISYVGEMGCEIHIPMELGGQVWDTLWEAGQPLKVVPAGIGVYGTTGRIEKSYRLYGADLEAEYNPVESGLVRPKVKPQDFIGKEHYLKAREQEPAATLCSLAVDDHKSATGELRYMLGKEPILTMSGKRIVDKKGRGSYVTSAGSAPSLQKHILMAYLPPEYAKEGTQLQVEYFNEKYPVTVAVAGATPLFDPDNKRMKL